MPPSFDLVSYSVSGNFLEVSAWSSGGGLGQFSHICGPDRTELALSTYLQINLQVLQTNIPQSCQGTEGKCTELFKEQLHGGSTGGTPTYAKQYARRKRGKANAFKIFAIKTQVLICLAFRFAFLMHHGISDRNLGVAYSCYLLHHYRKHLIQLRNVFQNNNKAVLQVKYNIVAEKKKKSN